MKIIVISGMLGAGKTSVLLKMMDHFISEGQKVAVIENEFGSKGVDGETVQRNGMEVRELKGGCVCCTMKSGMVDTLRYLETNVDPDVTIIEPSGVADPRHIVSVTEDLTGVTIDSLTTVIVVDAERYDKIRTMFERPLKNQLGVADIVLMNKIDTVSEKEIDDLEGSLRSYGFNGPILRTQAEEGTNIERLMEMLP